VVGCGQLLPHFLGAKLAAQAAASVVGVARPSDSGAAGASGLYTQLAHSAAGDPTAEACQRAPTAWHQRVHHPGQGRTLPAAAAAAAAAAAQCFEATIRKAASSRALHPWTPAKGCVAAHAAQVGGHIHSYIRSLTSVQWRTSRMHKHNSFVRVGKDKGRHNSLLVVHGLGGVFKQTGTCFFALASHWVALAGGPPKAPCITLMHDDACMCQGAPFQGRDLHWPVQSEYQCEAGSGAHIAGRAWRCVQRSSSRRTWGAVYGLSVKSMVPSVWGTHSGWPRSTLVPAPCASGCALSTCGEQSEHAWLGPGQGRRNGI